GISYLLFVLGPPPKGCTLDIMWTEYDIGESGTGAAPSIGIYQDCGDPPWEYINRAERLLQRLDDAVSWSKIAPDTVAVIVNDRTDERNDGDDGNEFDNTT